MIHPSYVELMRVVNDDVVIGEEPVVNSRYSIVCATAKRARQLIAGADPIENNQKNYNKKPLSIAVDELYEGGLKILTPEEANEQKERLIELKEKVRALREKSRSLEKADTVDVDDPGVYEDEPVDLDNAKETATDDTSDEE